MDDLYSIEEVARKLGGISKYTIEGWLAKGKMRRTKVGRRTMISESEVERFIDVGGIWKPNKTSANTEEKARSMANPDLLLRMCRVDNCFQKIALHNKSGLCTYHRVRVPKEKVSRVARVCSFSGCMQEIAPHNKSGRCMKHWYLKYGDELKDGTTPKPVTQNIPFGPVELPPPIADDVADAVRARLERCSNTDIDNIKVRIPKEIVEELLDLGLKSGKSVESLLVTGAIEIIAKTVGIGLETKRNVHFLLRQSANS
jgi:excisionase family DNA binding protein